MDLTQISTGLSVVSMLFALGSVLISIVKKDVVMEESTKFLGDQIVVVNELAMRTQRELELDRIERNTLKNQVDKDSVRFTSDIGYMKDTMIEIKDMIKELRTEVKDIKKRGI